MNATQRDSIYLDYAATSLINPRVVDAMSHAWRTFSGNPASQHGRGRQAKTALEDALDGIGELLGARVQTANPDRVVLTSGGTEANNLAILGLVSDRPGRVIVSTIEHPSTLGAAKRLEQLGWQVDWLRSTSHGLIDLDHLDALLQSPEAPPQLVSVMLANNETGVIQPVHEVVKRCQPRGIAVHTDAVQGVAKLAVSFQDLGVTAMTVAAHKFYGPTGVGALVVRSGSRLRPQLFGGAQQLGDRPGTEPVALAIGMHVALRLALTDSDLPARLEARRNELQRQVLEAASPAIVNGMAQRVPHILNVSFPGANRQALLMRLDLAGLCCSSGSACASGSSEPSHVLQAMNLGDALIDSAIRLSVGPGTTEAEITQAAHRISAAIHELRG